MTRLRQDAIELLEQMPEDKLIFMIQIMKGVRGLYKDENQEAKDLAFESLEKLRKKFSDLDYDKELAEYRRASMRILVDTNILLDYILDREPYGEAHDV